jgi:hypothetical protein
MRGIRGGSESAPAVVASSADKRVLESILNDYRLSTVKRVKGCGAAERL